MKIWKHITTSCLTDRIIRKNPTNVCLSIEKNVKKPGLFYILIRGPLGKYHKIETIFMQLLMMA